MTPSPYLVTIGLEVHCQVRTQSKMFCACQTSFGSEPNTHICPTCLGLPGALPTLNAFAIERTILTGMLLGCTTPAISKWDRKNYFYPDMPKNYQLTQLDLPLCLGGSVPLYDHNYPKDHQKKISTPGKVIRLNRIHLEEDVAKSTHLANASVIDFNRAGIPLMEIVSEAELNSAEEVVAYLKTLQQILKYGDISDADMDKGQMRADINISIRPPEQKELNPRIELKNLNSLSSIRRAIHYEVTRQSKDLQNGIHQKQATYRWDDDLGETQPMRDKEDDHDYRYFTEPDLLSIETAKLVEKVRPLVPELPHHKQSRFETDYGLTSYDASVLTSDQALADYFEKAAKASQAPPKKTANWIINNLLSLLNENALSITHCPLPPKKIAATLDLINSGTISNNQAKELFTVLWKSPEADPAVLAKEMGFEPADPSAIDSFIDEVIASNPDQVSAIQGGNEKLLNFLTGQVMKASKGKANPKLITEALRSKLL